MKLDVLIKTEEKMEKWYLLTYSIGGLTFLRNINKEKKRIFMLEQNHRFHLFAFSWFFIYNTVGVSNQMTKAIIRNTKRYAHSTAFAKNKMLNELMCIMCIIRLEFNDRLEIHGRVHENIQMNEWIKKWMEQHIAAPVATAGTIFWKDEYKWGL